MTDGALIAQYKQSADTQVLGVLYQRYMPMVYGACLKYLKSREESRDAVMQIFEKLVTSLLEHEVTHFKSWLYVTTRNHCFMYLRARKGKYFEEISPALMETGLDPHQDDGQEIESNLSKLEDCMATLGDEQKQCVQLFYLEQKCYQDIMQATGYDYKQVKSFIQNGKRNLKICMEKNG